MSTILDVSVVCAKCRKPGYFTVPPAIGWSLIGYCVDCENEVTILRTAVYYTQAIQNDSNNNQLRSIHEIRLDPTSAEPETCIGTTTEDPSKEEWVV